MANQDQAGNPLRVPEDPSRAWVVLHTRPRCEKRIEEFCVRGGIPVYLPLRKKVHQYGSRERAFWSPLFPGYAFCVVDQPQRATLRQNRHVANLLDVLDQETLVEQLRQIRQALDVGDIMEVMPYLEAGKRVRVTNGPLKGLEGSILRLKAKTRVVLNVDMIRQSVAVEVDSSYLIPA